MITVKKRSVMHKEGYYSSGEFAKKANVTVRTIRYYDKQNILKPSLLTEDGVRFYTDSDFTRLQQILLFKYLGFSLEDIRNMTIGDSDYHILMNSLRLQKRMIQDKIAQMQLVCKMFNDIEDSINSGKGIDWSNMLDIIHLTTMEDSIKKQYLNAENILARINLHNQFSINKQGWFPWVYEQCNIDNGMRILEVGCGDGSLWVDNIGQLAMKSRKAELSKKREGIFIDLTDVSEGMINDAERNVNRAMESWRGREYDVNFTFRAASCENTGAESGQYDLVIANHVLFYCDNIEKALAEIIRVLKPYGMLVCSTYGCRHMQEVNKLVYEYDNRIALEANKLFEIFGLDNGDKILNKYFSSVEKREYEDGLIADDAEPLVDYILSCHGNQKEYLVDKYTDFKKYVEKKLKRPMRITKEAGVFVCKK